MADNRSICDALDDLTSAGATGSAGQGATAPGSGGQGAIAPGGAGQGGAAAGSSGEAMSSGDLGAFDPGSPLLEPGDQFLPAGGLAGGEPSEEQKKSPNFPVMKWQSLTFGRLPGLDSALGAIKPPIEIIASLLEVIAGALDLLQMILVDLLDPYRALLLAAYQLLENLVKDLLQTGGYLYCDIPDISSASGLAEDIGIPLAPDTVFKAGMTEAPRPAPPTSSYARFAQRFRDSFDDPGDDRRPSVTKGATVAAVFIVGGAPTTGELLNALYTFGQLFNIKEFVNAWKHYKGRKYIKPRDAAAGMKVAPNWKSHKLRDIEKLQALEELPEQFRGLLFQADGLVQLLRDIGRAIENKIAQMQGLISALQGVIDFLDSLKAAGLYMLPVVTAEGIDGLYDRFMNAEGGPNQGKNKFVGGACFLAAGPGIKDMAVLWNLLTRGAVLEQVSAAWNETKQNAKDAWKQSEVKQKWNDAKQTARDGVNEMGKAIADAPQAFVDDLGRNLDDLEETMQTAPGEIVNWAKDSTDEVVKEGIAKAEAALDASNGRGPRSLAMGLGANPAVVAGAPMDTPGQESER